MRGSLIGSHGQGCNFVDYESWTVISSLPLFLIDEGRKYESRSGIDRNSMRRDPRLMFCLVGHWWIILVGNIHAFIVA